MTGYETPLLNKLAFGIGFATVMLWPVWVVSCAIGGIMMLNGRRRAGALLIGSGVVPALISGAVFLLVAQSVDIGSKDSLAARLIDGSGWLLVVFTMLGVLGSASAIIGWVMSWVQNERLRHV